MQLLSGKLASFKVWEYMPVMKHSRRVTGQNMWQKLQKRTEESCYDSKAVPSDA